MTRSWSPLVLLLLMIIGNGFVAPSGLAAPAEQPSRPGFRMAGFALLSRAREAQKAGRMEEANCLFQQAKQYLPDLQNPPWMKPIRMESSPREQVQTSRQELILQARTTEPREQVKAELEALLVRNPGDMEVREALLTLAQRLGDSSAILRHRSILEPSSTDGERPGWEWKHLLLVILLLGLVAWQGWQLRRELQNPSPPKDHPTK